jgi:hypothetical protein
MPCRHRIGMKRALRRSRLAAVLLALCYGQLLAAACLEPTTDRGLYFPKKAYAPAPLPSFETLKSRLPAPIDDAHPLWVKTYWKTWELAFRNFHEPPPGSGFVSQFIDAAFNDNIFLWDSAFMTLFTNYGAPLVPGIETLDNFYARQHADGEICREIVRSTGQCLAWWVNDECKPLSTRFGWSAHEYVRQTQEWRAKHPASELPPQDPLVETIGLDHPLVAWLELQRHLGFEGNKAKAPDATPVSYRNREVPRPNPLFTLEALGHPILGWAEWESFRVTGDKARLASVWEPLVRYYQSLQKYLLQGNGLYMTDWASMDNSPRNRHLMNGGTAVDTSSEMVLFARNLSKIATVLKKKREASQYAREADALAARIERQMWDPSRRFYFDLSLEGEPAGVKTIGAYWTLIAGVASAERAKRLVEEIGNPKTFGRPNAVPTLAADEPLYDSKGGYWRGAVWAPTTTMVIRGLEAYGYDELARRLAIQHLDLVADVYRATGTIWENYSPEKTEPGKPALKDFVGWSGIGPILYLLEYGIGLKPDAARNELLWNLQLEGSGPTRTGCERFRFNGHVVSLIAERDPADARRVRISVESDGGFTLKVALGPAIQSFAVREGRQLLTVSGS